MAGKYKRDGTLEGREPEPVPIGKVFGAWTYVGKGSGYRYRVRCICGVEREVRSQDLRMGASTSCGCQSKTPGLVTIGRANTTHGMDYGSKLYRAWRNAKNRVFNKRAEKYKSYGASGVDMDPEWAESFEKFAAHLGDAPGPEFSLDRIDVNKGYWPGNVRWATTNEQARNKHNTIRITYGGITRSLSDWCEQLGIKRSAAAYRYHKGWCAEDVLFGRGKSNGSSIGDKRSAHRGESGGGDYSRERPGAEGAPAGSP